VRYEVGNGVSCFYGRWRFAFGKISDRGSSPECHMGFDGLICLSPLALCCLREASSRQSVNQDVDHTQRHGKLQYTEKHIVAVRDRSLMKVKVNKVRYTLAAFAEDQERTPVRANEGASDE
jgi:hypothetical protein